MIPHIPELLLDMDGVQCDLFGAWAKIHNVATYKDTSEDDWIRFSQTGADPIYQFFRTLRPLPGGTKLVKWLVDNNVNFRVCTAPIRGPYSDASKTAKYDWIAEHVPGYEHSIIFSSAKYKHAKDSNGRPRLLVDDFGVYVDKFAEAGGWTIKYEDAQVDAVISRLEAIYLLE